MTIELKDVWKSSTQKGVYKVYVHEDKLEFNLIYSVSLKIMSWTKRLQHSESLTWLNIVNMYGVEKLFYKSI
jgi:hypothetical protein